MRLFGCAEKYTLRTAHSAVLVFSKDYFLIGPPVQVIIRFHRVVLVLLPSWWNASFKFVLLFPKSNFLFVLCKKKGKHLDIVCSALWCGASDFRQSTEKIYLGNNNSFSLYLSVKSIKYIVIWSMEKLWYCCDGLLWQYLHIYHHSNQPSSESSS